MGSHGKDGRRAGGPAAGAGAVVVLDGDALIEAIVPVIAERSAPTVLTPHDGEWARLGGSPAGTLLIGESTPLHRGKTTMVWQTRISTDEGRLMAMITQTQFVFPAKT